jgi:hypothetical protein
MFSATIGMRDACARAAAGAHTTRAADATIPRPGFIVASGLPDDWPRFYTNDERLSTRLELDKGSHEHPGVVEATVVGKIIDG